MSVIHESVTATDASEIRVTKRGTNCRKARATWKQEPGSTIGAIVNKPKQHGRTRVEHVDEVWT